MQDHEIPIYKLIRKAIKDGRLPEVERIIVEDNDRLQMDTPFGTWLHMAAAHGKLDIVKWLLLQGVNVNSRGGTIEGRPLDEAAANGHPEVVKCLIESGASLDTSESLRNPLFAAIVGGLSDSHTAVAKLLIDAGIDTSVRYPNLNGMNALDFAKEWGRSDIVKLLEERTR